MVSQKQVAKAAGVSMSTTSLALNNHPSVSAKTTLRVQEVAKRLGYVPNHAARKMIRSRFGNSSRSDLHQIGVVSFVKATKKDALNPTDMAFLNGLEQEIAEFSGALLYMRQKVGESSKRLAEMTYSGAVEGLVVFGYVGDEQLGILNGLGRPWVVLGDHSCSIPVHQVNVDYSLMGKLAVQQPIERGHHRIGFIGSRMEFSYSKEILAGFREEMDNAGLTVSDSLILTSEDGSGDPQPWLAEALTQVRQLESPPTAFVYAQPGESGVMLSVCNGLGINVPDDMSFVFCEMNDSVPFVADIARVEASAAELGRSAVHLLRDVADQKNGPVRQLSLTPKSETGWSVGNAAILQKEDG